MFHPYESPFDRSLHFTHDSTQRFHEYDDKADLTHKGERENPLAFTLTRIGYEE